MSPTSIRSVLAASDLGEGSDKIVQSAASLARSLGAQLHGLHVLDVDVLPSPDETGHPPSFPERLRQAEQMLADQISRFAPGLQPASLRVMNTAVHEAIIARASEVSADVIVVGPHRGGHVGAHFLGTTAEHVLRGSEIPCLVASAPLPVPVRTLMVATDFSAPARAALDIALALSSPLGDERAEIRFVHVGQPVERVDNPGLEEKKLRPILEREISDAIARSGAPESPVVRPEVVWGVSPTEAIVKSARQSGTDLLVLGSQGQSGIKRLILGSVASGVARQAPCPVLVVPVRHA